MKALEISILIFCMVLGMTIMNSTGVMSAYTTPATAEIGNISEGDDIVKLDSGSDSGISNDFFGWGAVTASWGMFKDFLYYLTLPGDYLYKNGCPLVLAGAIQAAMNLITLIGVFQVITKINLEGLR